MVAGVKLDSIRKLCAFAHFFRIEVPGYVL